MAFPFPSIQHAEQDELSIDISFDGLIARYKGYLATLPETRRGNNSSYTILDAALGAFSVFFMQQPSFLAAQRLLNKKHQRSNAQTLFGMAHIPTDNQIRNILDPLAPDLLTPLFDDLYQGLYQHGYLERYKAIDDNLLIALDGTQYFSSNKLHCKNCSTQEHKNGEVSYSHKAVTPVIVSPNTSEVISLPAEFIGPQDGHSKQDSEHQASKRWLEKHGKKYQNFNGVTILGDDLFAHQPLCEAIQAQGLNFILTCKEKSHKTLYEYVNGAISIQTRKIQRQHGKKKFIDTYRFLNGVPIRAGDNALEVNWCEITTTNAQGDVIYHAAFITDHLITKQNIATIVSNGRARWHIENGNNNVLKTKGYHLMHNFGHGKQYLASFLLTLNLLAFLFHTILQLHDVYYQAIRQELPTRKIFFQHLNALTTYLLFKNWLHLMRFMADSLEIELIDSG